MTNSLVVLPSFQVSTPFSPGHRTKHSAHVQRSFPMPLLTAWSHDTKGLAGIKINNDDCLRTIPLPSTTSIE